MGKEKIARDKAAEKAVKERLSKTHLKSIKILGSEKRDDVSIVYVLRMCSSENYLFKVNCTAVSGKSFSLSGLIPVNNSEEFGQYRVYNPKTATADVLRPIEKEKKFTGYNK